MQPKLSIVSGIALGHELAQKFNDELEKLDQRKLEILYLIEREQKKVLANVEKVYLFTVRSAAEEPYLPDTVRGNDPIRIARIWANKEEFVRIAKERGYQEPKESEVALSPIYYRLNGILLSHGKFGQDILEDKVPCTDEEWNSVKAGSPGRLLKGAYREPGGNAA